ncbi:hypothetical protein FMM05_14065 [Flavobacterium zepuense]|uniref:DUF4468 domain-containing protein n=1 Tax=Flavobacterium zepuense TaxID=2593302 RepID=A0A552UYJ8_9FLAO|nr:hypothetical protein [Flavobacterium zepuense]TRW23316.1 hypothetical protein FMM05_14065 [Flavobacterium zepuense]
MKTPFLIVTFLITSCFGAVAQDKKSLEIAAAKMYRNTVEANATAMVDDMYPKYFETTPKQTFIDATKKMDNPNFKMTVISTPSNLEYGVIKKIDAGSYCVIKHDLLMKIAFKTILPPGEIENMTASFKTNLKASEVVYKPADNSFLIKKKEEVIAVADKLTNNQWKFIKKDHIAIMDKLLDKKVVKALGI